MKYLLKIFIVSVLTCCVTARVSCANNGTKKAIQGRDKFHITVKNHQGIGISGLRIQTTNLKQQQLAATTNNQGVATFENVCEAFAKLGRTQFPVQIKITDSFGKYKTYNSVLWFDNFRMGCEREIKLPKDSITYKFPPADQLKGLAFNQRTGKLKFYSVCDTETKIPSGAKGECVKIFREVNTQYQPAVELVQEYVYEKIGPYTIQCQMRYRQDGNNDYLACTSTDGKYVFEFEFDDLVESVDDDMRYGTLKGLCTLYGGRILPNKQTVCMGGEKIKTGELCNKLKVVSDKFAFSATYEQDRSTVTPTRNYYCYVDFKVKTADESVKTYPGLDPFIFQGYQTKFDNSTKVLIGQYVESKLGSDFKSLECASMTKAYYGKNVKGTSDDIIECVLTTTKEKGSYNIEFVFDDLSEFSGITSQADKSKMACLVDGGKYVAGRCTGVSEAQCNALGIQFGVKTRFNPKLQICDLPDAKTSENVDALIEGAVALGFFAATVASGGTLAIVAASTSIVLTEVNKIQQNVGTSSGFDILNLINQCGCKTACTSDKCNVCNTCNSKNCDVDKIYDLVPYAMVNSTPDMQAILDESLKSIEDSCIDEKDLPNKLNTLVDRMSFHQVIKDAIDTGAFAASMVSLSPSSHAIKAIKGMKATNTLKQVQTVSNDVKATTKASGLATDVYTVVSASDLTSTTQPTKGK
ncbi:MAG: hypothetical protein E7007_03130 [Alphaproteobacteria bacterium]|nr:hypothetical protein [Alphaproteobacteria bacterium]